MNVLALVTDDTNALNQVYNTAVGDRTTLLELVTHLKEILSDFDPKIAEVAIKHGPNRLGDIPHSLASVDKAKQLLSYNPTHNIKEGLQAAIAWYYKNLNPNT